MEDRRFSALVAELRRRLAEARKLTFGFTDEGAALDAVKQELESLIDFADELEV